MNEIDSLMRTDAGGVMIYEGDIASHIAQLDEWLLTPVGSIWGLPSWGHSMGDFRHAPSGNGTEIAIEGALMTKIHQDLPQLPLQGIRCNTVTDEFDLFWISFVFPFGIFSTQITSEGIA